MPNGNVTIVMKAADAELLRAWQRAREGPAQYEQELRRVKGQGGQLQQSSEGMFRSIGAGFARAAASTLGFAGGLRLAHQAVGLLRKEYDELLKRQGAAENFQTGVAGAQRAALRNLGTDLSAKELQSTVGQIAGETGADQATLYNAAAGVLSARGKFSSQEALGQLAAVTRLDPTMAPQDLQSLAGGTLDIRKAFGGTAEQAIGGVLIGQQTARVEETGQYARNIVPALIGLKNFGQEFREASALVSAITQQSADVEGARSGTASIQFAKEVTAATLPVKELQGKGLTERLEYLRTGQERGDKRAEQIRRSLVGGFDTEALKAGVDEKGSLTGEAKQYTAMIGLLTRGSDAMAAYEEALSQTPRLEEGQRVYQRKIEEQREVGIQTTARTTETFRAAQQTRLGDEREGLLGATKEGLEEYLTQLGGFGQKDTGLPSDWVRSLEIVAFEKQAAAHPERDPRRLAASLLEGRARLGEQRATTPEEQAKVREIRTLEANLLNQALDDLRRRGDTNQAGEVQAALAQPVFRDIPRPEPAQPAREARRVSEGPVNQPTAPRERTAPLPGQRSSPLPASPAAPRQSSPAADAEAQVKLLRAALGTAQRKGNDDEIAQLRRELANQSRILQEIARNTADKNVRIENSNEPRRTANRAKIRPAPIKQAGQ